MLTGRPTQSAEPIGADEIARAVEDAARRQAQDRSSPLTELAEWIVEHLGFEAVGRTWEVGLWILVTVLALVVASMLARTVADALRRAGPGVPGEPSGAPVAERVRELRLAADRARAAGEYRLALRHQLFALILGLGGRGDLEYRDGWTNRELLRRGRPSDAASRLLAPLVDELEAKEFGDEPVLVQDVERLEALCVRHLGHLEAGAS